MYPNSGLLWGAGLMQTGLALAEIHLFKAGEGVILAPGITLAELAAAEADFTGYSAEVITAFNPPALNPIGGAGIDSGYVQFQIASPYTTPNTIAGGWIETAGGVLVMVWDYDPPRSLVGAGDAVPVDLIPIFG